MDQRQWFTRDHIVEFHDRGFVIIRHLIAEEVLDEIRGELSSIVDELANDLWARGLIADRQIGAPFEKRLARLYADRIEDAPGNLRAFLHREAFFSIFFHAAILDIAEAILGPPVRLYLNYSVRPKLPNAEASVVLWHQDGGYTETLGTGGGPVEGLRMMNLWTPLVPATVATGCMQFIPETHRLGLVAHERREHYLEIEARTLGDHLHKRVDIEMEPGDVVFFHNLLFHRGLPNVSDIIRWSLDWRYQDAQQPTLRKGPGFLARGTSVADRVVASAAQWAGSRLDNEAAT